MAATNLGNVAIVSDGPWSNSKAYTKNFCVGYNGRSYISLKTVPVGTLPTDTAYWMLSGDRGADGDVTTAAMNAAISLASSELQEQIDSLDSGLNATNSAVIPIIRGGHGATTASGARSNLGITPTNIGAAPTNHNHSTSNITSGVLPLPRGGTGQTTAAGIRNIIGLGNETGVLGYQYGGLNSNSLYQAQSNLGVLFFSTTTPAVTPTLASYNCFELYMFGRFVNFHMRYSTRITSGLHSEVAIIPYAYRPQSATLIPLSVYVADTLANVKAYATNDGIITIRTDSDLEACTLSGFWTTN